MRFASPDGDLLEICLSGSNLTENERWETTTAVPSAMRDDANVGGNVSSFLPLGYLLACETTVQCTAQCTAAVHSALRSAFRITLASESARSVLSIGPRAVAKGAQRRSRSVQSNASEAQRRVCTAWTMTLGERPLGDSQLSYDTRTRVQYKCTRIREGDGRG